MSEKIENVVIVGSGPAGWTAAIYAARANLNPLLYEGAALQEHYDLGRGPLGQLAMTTEVENFPGFPSGDLSGYLDNAIDDSLRQYMAPHQKHGVSGPELMELMRQQAKNFGTRVVTDDIIEVDFSGKPFKLKPREGDQWLEARSVIIATGARANYLGLESENKYKNRGVSACAVCDGALPRFRNKPCVVVGGGDSAIEEADYLSKYSSVVYLVHRRDKFRASQAMVDRIMANDKVEVVWNHVVKDVLGDDQNGVTGAKLASTVDDSTKEVETSGFFLAIGHTPNTDFLKGKLEMNNAGYLKWTVPFRTNTSVDGVFAAGDVADDNYRQAITAAGSGCMAALDAERWLASQGLH